MSDTDILPTEPSREAPPELPIRLELSECRTVGERDTWWDRYAEARGG